MEVRAERRRILSGEFFRVGGDVAFKLVGMFVVVGTELVVKRPATRQSEGGLAAQVLRAGDAGAGDRDRCGG